MWNVEIDKNHDSFSINLIFIVVYSNITIFQRHIKVRGYEHNGPSN